MEDLVFENLRKKKIHIGFRVSEAERKLINEFCEKEQINLTDLVRYAIRQVIKEKSK